MSEVQTYGGSVTGATMGALQAYERALAAHRSWRTGVDEWLDAALRQAPAFVMAHALRAWRLVCSRDPRRVAAARRLVPLATRLPANDQERLHLAALTAVLVDDFAGAKAFLSDALQSRPRDALALQVAHALDYLSGDAASLCGRVASALPAWSSDMPGYHAVLAMYAFGLEECGEYARAEEAARAALALEPADARAHHVMAHVFEMTGRADEGARWMYGHLADWSVGTVVATHGWWHVALFHLAQGQVDQALRVYDSKVRAHRSGEVADLIDAASLLWRIELAGGEPAARWSELAGAWAFHIDDAYCSFSDLHAMLAFVGARAWRKARRLERAMARAQFLPTRYGETTRQVGLPACRGLIALGRGDDALAASLLANLPPQAYRLGGSHAQRDVLHLALARALERKRARPSATGRFGWTGVASSKHWATA